MGRVLVGERNLEHRRVLKKAFGRLTPSLALDFVGNGEDMLACLGEQAVHREPVLIMVDPNLPCAFSGSIVRVIKADDRFSKIPIIILADQAGMDYYALRGSGLVALSFLKPSLASGWELLVRRIMEFVGPEIA
jgi:CheY-like chemotaxis protein